MKTAIFLSIREKAKRLPKKVLLKVKDKTLTEHLINRLKEAKLPDKIVLCTSINTADDVLIDIAKKTGIEYFRGSEDDKLGRYFNAALKFKIDFMIIVDGDDIFCDPEYIDKTIQAFIDTGADFITARGLPLGVAATGIELDALKKVCEMKTEKDTEVWGGYFTESGLFDVKYLEVDDEKLRHPEIRMTVDYQEDFEFVKEIFNRLYKEGKVFSLREIMQLLKKHPELIEINRKCQKLYGENLKKITKIEFKK